MTTKTTDSIDPAVRDAVRIMLWRLHAARSVAAGQKVIDRIDRIAAAAPLTVAQLHSDRSPDPVGAVAMLGRPLAERLQYLGDRGEALVDPRAATAEYLSLVELARIAGEDVERAWQRASIADVTAAMVAQYQQQHGGCSADTRARLELDAAEEVERFRQGEVSPWITQELL